MKIINLLNKIANGEETPNKIKFDNTIWNKRHGEKNVCYENDEGNDLFIYIFRRNLTFTLNDEIEIIEENDIEKLPMVYNGDAEDEIMRNRYKINEIIDKINEMSDKQ